jgi:drug/metabolite transporter superfamily protein YnfA
LIAAAIAEIGGAYLVWLGIKEHKGPAFVVLGAIGLAAYGIVAACSSSARCSGASRSTGSTPTVTTPPAR